MILLRGVLRDISLQAILVTMILFAFETDASAEKRIALVIGNSAYPDAPLKNPKNDAALMVKTLETVGFAVTHLADADQRAMKRAMVEFGRALRGSDSVGLFYYAGHGVQVEGENYLIPVGAVIRDEFEVPIEGVSVNEFLRTMRRASSRINIVVLDACRNNPFARSFRSSTRGLARVDAPKGTYVAYATSPGAVALDGETGHSPYTQALAKAMTTPGLLIEQVFKEARREVLAATGEKQTPWETSSIVGRFYFKNKPEPPKVVTPAPAPKQDKSNLEITFWATIKDSKDPALYDAYLKQFPNGTFAGLARILKQQSEAMRAAEAETARLAAQKRAQELAAREANLEAARKAAELEAERKAAELEAARKAAELAAKERAAELAAREAELKAKAAERRAAELAAQQRAEELAARLAELKAKADKLAEEREQRQRLALAVPEAADAEDDVNDADLPRKIQQRLSDAGCNPGTVDGQWGRNSKAALQRFARYAKVSLPDEPLSVDTLKLLRRHEGLVCPLVCNPRQIKRGDTCVARTCPAGQILTNSGQCIDQQKQQATVPNTNPAPAANRKNCMVCTGINSPKAQLVCGSQLRRAQAVGQCS